MNGAWASAAAIVLLAIAASILVERAAARPGAPAPALAAVPVRAVVVAALFLFWLGLFRRPWLTGFATLTTVAIVTAISVRKRQLVAEPLVFSDFALLRLVVRHPDLYYLGFMADPRFIAAAAAFVSGLAVWIWFERPLLAPLAGLGLTFGVLSAIALLWRAAGAPALARFLSRLVPCPDLENHTGRWGLFLTLASYALRWRAETRAPPVASEPGGSLGGGPDLVIVVQLESFTDPRRSGLPIIPMPGLDQARALAAFHGPLDVPSHGAFTMRSEYAVLTGLEPAESGFRQFDPYLSSAGGAPPTLATWLRSRGRRTLFMHPFRASFFNRETVMPRLGFEEFRWEDDFAGAERLGPYVSDVALAARVLAEARAEPGRPALIMAVTMENHGPWPADRLPDEPDATRQYLRHLAGSDRAISTLIDGLADHPGRALLCFFGDHPPILPGIDRTRPPQTDYVLLELGTAASRPKPVEAPLTAAGLGRLLLRAATEPVIPARPARA